MKKAVLVILLLITQKSFEQVIYPYRTVTSPKELVEFSGIAKIDKNLLVGVNDGGNLPCLFFMDTTGKLLRKRCFKTIKNIDWEEVCYDKGIVYICDVGDNNSARKQTMVYYYDVKKDTITGSKKIEFAEKAKLPLPKTKLNYDCEAAFARNNKVWFFTKTHASPYLGMCYQYSTVINDKTYIYSANDSISFGKNGFIYNSITGAALSPKGINTVFISCTHVWFKFGFWESVSYLNELTMDFDFDGITQKEAVTFLSDHKIVVADERTAKVMGGRMYFFDVKPYMNGVKKYVKPEVRIANLKKGKEGNIFTLSLDQTKKPKKLSVLLFDKNANYIATCVVKSSDKIVKEKIKYATNPPVDLVKAVAFWIVDGKQVIYAGKIQ